MRIQMIKKMSVFMLLLSSCCVAFSQSYPTAEVNYLGEAEPGTMLIKVVGYGSTKAAASNEAQAKAFRTLLFRGIPGSPQATPLVENEANSSSENGAYYTDFFEQQRYKTFLMQSGISSKLARRAGQKQASFSLKINLAALRKDLEQNGIIRKFGL